MTSRVERKPKHARQNSRGRTDRKPNSPPHPRRTGSRGDCGEFFSPKCRRRGLWSLHGEENPKSDRSGLPLANQRRPRTLSEIKRIPIYFRSASILHPALHCHAENGGAPGSREGQGMPCRVGRKRYRTKSDRGRFRSRSRSRWSQMVMATG